MAKFPQKVVDLSEAVRAAGGRALLVGGCVRDLLMGHEPKDWDLEVYGIEPPTVARLLDSLAPLMSLAKHSRFTSLAWISMSPYRAVSGNPVPAIVRL